MLGIVTHPTEATRPPGVQPGKTDEIETWARGHAPLVGRLSRAIEYGYINPAEITAIAGTPNHSTQRSRPQIETRVAPWRWLPARGVWGIRRSLDPLLANPGVDTAADAAIHSVRTVEVGRQVIVEPDVAGAELAEPAMQLQTLQSSGAQVDFPATIPPREVVIGLGAHRFRVAMLADWHGVIAHAIEPVDHVPAAVTVRGAGQGSLEVRQNSVPEVVLASPAVTEVP